MQVILLLLCAISSVHLTPIEEAIAKVLETCGYESCQQVKPGFLNVHIVPHTHDDVGWLKTVDQYYYGSLNYIQKAGVQYILDSVVKELWDDPQRRFIYVETAFFWKWWVRQPKEIQEKVHTLVRQGRLQMVGGAWSMNDEAASHYQSTIDQFTWGLSKLNKTFGYCGRPRVGWQIDPFGHSREFASLLAMMGYDGLFLGRIDYQDKENRLRKRNMEMVWRGDDDLGKSSDIFTGVLHNTYSPPPGFCFDVLCSDEPIIDDPDSPMYNVENKVAVFLDAVKNQAKFYRTNNVIMTMGGDFTYQDAHMWYINLDKLITYTNLKAAKDGMNITLFYSTPDCYLKAIKDANPFLPTKQDDFFPYASDPTAYWTGYFTSRPTTKYFEREGNDYLQMLKQLQVLANLEDHNQFVLDELKSAMGVMQHHDAITGTEKQHVAHDYERILNQAIDDALIIAREAFNKAMLNDPTKPPILALERCHLNESRCDVSETSEKFVVTIYNPLAWSVSEPIRIPVLEGTYQIYGPDGKLIPIQTIDIPDEVRKIPTRFSKAVQELVFIVNLKPLSYKSLYVKRINRNKRNTKKDYETYINDYWKNLKEPIINKLEDTVIMYTEEPRNNQIPLAPVYSPEVTNIDYKDANLDILKDGKNDQEFVDLETYLRNARQKKDQDFHRRKVSYPNLNEDELRMLSDEPRIVERFDDEGESEHGNQAYKVAFSAASGLTQQLKLSEHSTLNMSINMYYYTGSCGDNFKPETRSSGAYIFRPTNNNPTKLTPMATHVVKGDIVEEFRVNLEPNGYINYKRYVDLSFIEIEWIVGPISIADKLGKEYVIKYETNIFNNGEFYTDSNGRQMLKRKLNYRPQWNVTLAEPVAGNYYPVTNEIYIENKRYRLTVLTDRSQGGTSLREGEIELMLHRRLLCDDAFGVGEPLNETAKDLGLVVRGNHRFFLRKDTEFVKKHVLGMHLSPLALFSNADDLRFDEWLKLRNEYSWMNKNLPQGAHLLTLEPWDSKMLLRIENYLEKGLHTNVEVNLRGLFKNIELKCIKETMLAANMWEDEYDKWSWNTNNDFGEKKTTEEPCVNDDFKIILKAKEIRTFIIDYDVKEN